MADHATLAMPDLQAFMAELRSLPVMVQQRIAKGAAATAASVIRTASIERAPLYIPASVMQGGGHTAKNHPPPGTLKRAIFQARMTDQCSLTKEVWMVGVRTGNKSTQKGSAMPDAFYAKWVEFGHFTRTPRGAGTQKARRAAARASGAARWVPPQPFMRPAFDASQAAALQAMADYIQARLPAETAANKFLKAA